MNKRGRGRPTSYEAYSRDWDATEKAMKARGYTMAETKYTKEEWKRAHRAEKNDRLKAIKEGKRKTIGNINRDLIRRQQWQYTESQAKAQRRAYEMSGGKEKIKLSDIRGGKVEAVDWTALSNREKELRNLGWGWGRVHAKVSEEFFGS